MEREVYGRLPKALPKVTWNIGGALRAWSWGAARGLDYLETDSAVDAKHVGIEGVSRYGKAALVTLAFEQRFAMGLIGSSGEGGAKLNRRNWGEAVENLTGGEYYWMAGTSLSMALPKPSAPGQHNGGHTDAPNMKYFIEWADKFIWHSVPSR